MARAKKEKKAAAMTRSLCLRMRTSRTTTNGKSEEGEEGSSNDQEPLSKDEDQELPPDDENLITQSTAISPLYYCLNKKDLTELPVKMVPNPHYASAAPMKLYVESDVFKLSIKRFRGQEGLEDEKAKRAAKTVKLAAKKANKSTDREKELEHALAALGLGKRRNDSILCNDFVNGSRGLAGRGYKTAEAVAVRMAQMRYLFDHTDYESIKDALFSEARIDSRDFGRRYDKDEVLFEAEEKALCRLGGRGYPAAWPWMEQLLENRKPAFAEDVVKVEIVIKDEV